MTISDQELELELAESKQQQQFTQTTGKVCLRLWLSWPDQNDRLWVLQLGTCSLLEIKTAAAAAAAGCQRTKDQDILSLTKCQPG